MKRLIYFFFAAAMMLSVAGCNDDPDFIKNAPPSSGETDGTDDDSDAGDDGTVEGVDPNFQIYLCFGQSNMEGFAQGDYNGIEDIDKTVDERFQVMNVVSGSWNGVQREVGHWYTAVPPLCRSNTGLCPADYFGRTMVDELSKTNPDIKVGVIVVAIGGASIRAFHKTEYASYYNEMKNNPNTAYLANTMGIYGGNPYATLVDMARIAQKQGVIKGILMHQGESDACDAAWRQDVADIYNSLVADLSLKPESTPLLIGELLDDGQGHGNGVYKNSSFTEVRTLVPNAYVVSSEGCTVVDASIDPDNAGNNRYLHFSSEGYRKLGRNYAQTMLDILANQEPEQPGKEIVPIADLFKFDSEYFDYAVGGDNSGASWNPDTKEFQTTQYGVFGWHYGDKYADISSYNYLVVELQEPQTANAGVCIYSDSEITGRSYLSSFSEGENGGTRVVIDLSQGLNANVNNNSQVIPIDLTSVKIIGIWSHGSSKIKFKDIYLTNERPTDSGNPEQPEKEIVPIEDLFNFDSEYFDYAVDGDNSGASWNPDTKEFQTTQYGVFGWHYGDKYADISSYNYLVVELQEPQNTGAGVCIYSDSKINGRSYLSNFSEGENGGTRVVIDLSQGLNANVNNGDEVIPIDLTSVKIIGIWSYGSSVIKFDKIYLTNERPTDS